MNSWIISYLQVLNKEKKQKLTDIRFNDFLTDLDKGSFFGLLDSGSFGGFGFFD